HHLLASASIVPRRDVAEVAGVTARGRILGCTMGRAIGIEVVARRGGVRRGAVTDLVDVQTMRAGLERLEGRYDAHAAIRWGERNRAAGHMPLGRGELG